MPSWQRWWNHWKDIPTNGLTTSEGLSFSEFTSKLTPSKTWYLDVFWIASNPTPSQNDCNLQKGTTQNMEVFSFAAAPLPHLPVPRKIPVGSVELPSNDDNPSNKCGSMIVTNFRCVPEHWTTKKWGATVWKSMGRGCQEKVVAMTSG